MSIQYRYQHLVFDDRPVQKQGKALLRHSIFYLDESANEEVR